MILKNDKLVVGMTVQSNRGPASLVKRRGDVMRKGVRYVKFDTTGQAKTFSAPAAGLTRVMAVPASWEKKRDE